MKRDTLGAIELKILKVKNRVYLLCKIISIL